MYALSIPAAGRRAGACAVALIALALMFCAPAARADFGLAPGSFSTTLSTTQAGAPIDLETSFTMATQPGGTADGSLRDLSLDLPPGIIGDPTATPRCKVSQLTLNACPAASQVGWIYVLINFLGTPVEPNPATPVYNMVPDKGQTAELAAVLWAPTVTMKIHVRTDGDYGLTTDLHEISDWVPIYSTQVKLWGIPADSSHDGERGSCLGTSWDPSDMCPTTAPRRPFLRNPSACGPQQPSRVALDSWQNAGAFVHDSAAMPDITGCEKLPPVQPKATVRPADRSAGAPTGYDVDLDIPQVDNPDAIATPPLKKVSIDFPAGTAISPGSADGLGACTDEQLHQHDTSPMECPNASKIGSVSITTPYLPDPLEGAMYLGQPKPDDQFRLFLVAEGSGVSVRQIGSAVPDPKTGHLVATFSDLPPVAFSHLHVHMKGGPRAVLVNPSLCGTATSTTTVTPYGGGAAASDSSSFDVGGNCAAPGFAPALSAGTTNPVAGAESPFVLQIRRGDGQQDLQAVGVDLPAGLIGKVAGLPLCPSAQAAAGTCGDASKVGTVAVTVGTGSNPIALPGSAYMTEAYGGPFGLVFVVPAKIGPFDFGDVVVRAKVNVDPLTGALSVQTDPMPSIIAGIPLHYRTVTVNIDRPGFMVNPTSCAPSAIAAAVQSTAGAVANVASRFQVGDCAALPFAPKMAMRLTNRSQVTDGRHPGLDVLVTQGAGQANLKQVQAALPLSLALDPKHSESDALCSFADGLKDQCPVSSEIGTAEAVSPLLNKHLFGKVYFVKGLRVNSKGQLIRTLPTLLIPLRGEINIDLRATSKVDSEGRLVTTFANIPDAALSGFRLTLRGGRKGILVVTGKKNLCRGKQVSDVQTDGQNGKTRDFSVAMKAPCVSAKMRARASAKKRS